MKRFLSILIALGLFLSGSVIASAQEQEIDTSIVDKLYHITSMGRDIRTEYTPDGEMSRGLFAYIAAAIMGFDAENDSYETKQVFTDVTAEHEFAPSIAYLFSAGIMSGDDKASFRPDSGITYDEAVKTAAIMLGYTTVSELKGGFSTGYIDSAASAGLLRGVSASAGAAMTQRNIYKLFDNLLEVHMLTASVTGGLQASDDKREYTILKNKLGIETTEGIVDGFEYSSLAGDADEKGPDILTVNGAPFTMEYTEGYDYVGMYVTVYHDSDDNVIYIEVNDQKTKVLNVKASEIESETNTSSLSYRPGNSGVKRAAFDNEAVFLYNGKKLNAVNDFDLIPDEGDLTLIDNDRDGKYEVIRINAYDVFVVDSVLSEDELIKFKYDMGNLDVSEGANQHVRYFLEDSPAELDDIAKWSVISVKRSKNLKGTVLCDIYITNTSFDSQVTSCRDEGDDYYVTLSDGNEYMLSESYINRVNFGAVDSAYPPLSRQLTVYLDRFGKIAAVNTVAGGKNYGYVVRCNSDEETEKVTLRLFTKNSEFIDFTVKSKVTVNGTAIDSSHLSDRLKNSSGTGLVNQLIVYTANGDNEITKIQLAEDKTSEVYYIAKEDEFVLNCHPINSGGMRFYKYLAENRPLYYLEGTTINFQIPTDIKAEEDYKISTKLASTDVKLGGPLYIYDAGNGGMIGAIVSSLVDDSDYSLPAVVDYVKEVVNEDDEVCKEIVFIGGSSVQSNGNSVKYSQPLKDTADIDTNWKDRIDYTDITIDDLKRGDIVEYTKLNGKLDALRVMVKADNIGPIRIDGDNLQKNGSMLCKVISVSDNKRTAVVHYYDRYNKDIYQSMFINGSVYKVDTKKDEVTYSSTGDIEPGDTLFINSFWWSPKVIVIYR
ncbi:MAG: S-layer homology domain-containing protein [Clostridia bacterium]|nr:S-layer homology domain-containing protein [Clostridia bacterium]